MTITADDIEKEFKDCRRRSQTRKVIIRAVHLDLPPDLSIAVRSVAKSAGVTPEALLMDVLRDIFEPVTASQGELALRKAG